MQQRHRDKKQYFREQISTSEKYVLPFIEQHKLISTGSSVLEIGCGEGGNLVPFLKKGAVCWANDVSASKMENAKTFLQQEGINGQLHLLPGDIFNIQPSSTGMFEVLIMRDVIEHIHDQKKFMRFVKSFLKPGAVFFLAFPPWYMPFGGHQQICRSKILSSLPWIHLLPAKLYALLLKLFREDSITIDSLLEIKQTGISIERFEKIVAEENYFILAKKHYLVNPNYEVKFGLKPRQQYEWIAGIPFLRNFFTTCSYYLLRLEP
jgi:SAM-dependent methyltransferase